MKHYMQQWESATSSNRNELVFANRNQQYGAYVLRQEYQKSVTKAFLITCLISALLMVVPYLKSLFVDREMIRTNEEMGLVFDLTPLVETPEIPIEIPKLEKVATPSTYEFRVPKIVDDFVNDNQPIQNPNSNLNPGLTNNLVDSATLGDDEIIIATTMADTAIGITDVQEVPFFEGGNSGMMNYLIRNIKYPHLAKDANIKGTVYISFVIDKTGAVKDATIMRGIGGGCDEEALRVVNGMPAWTPGKQNGRAVMVRLVLPLQFSLR